VLARVQTGAKVVHFETERQAKDGRHVSVSLTLVNELRQTSNDLMAAANRGNEFLAMIGHELRNPLSALAHGLPCENSVFVFTVRDNGIGMSADLLPHVFEVFTQAPRALDRAEGGLGLGLPMVQRYRILVVDDEEDTSETFAELLREDGHETRAVNDGQAALEAMRTFEPEVVLLDLGLPGMDGYELARELRDTQGDSKLLLVAVTGYQADAARLEQTGFDRHLIKPPDLRKLSTLLAGWDGGTRST